MMACKTCGAPTGWVRGSDLERANESKRAAMADAVALRKDAERWQAAARAALDVLDYLPTWSLAGHACKLLREATAG